jgi:small subunit ribosomal protein S9
MNTLRVVPASPSYFTSRPNFTDHYLEISALYRKHQLLPTGGRAETKITWLTLPEYKALIGDEPVASGRYRELIKMCGKLGKINTHLMPDEVHAALQRFMKEEQPVVRYMKKDVIDEHGRAYGLGRRKTATARAWIVSGKGNVLVNGKSLSQYFTRLHQRQSAIYALSITDRVGDYNVFAVVEGGGNTGQAEALTLAVAKALLVYEPSLKMRLKSGKSARSEPRRPYAKLTPITAGCLTRDRRKVERKKPGHLKARKKPAWVKR